LLTCGGGVPLDQDGVRQPLLAHCPPEWELNSSEGRISSLFSNLQDLKPDVLAHQMKNFNTPDD